MTNIDSRLRQQCSKLCNIVVGVLSLAPCYSEKNFELQVRRADQALYPIQSGSFVGRGPWLYATSPCKLVKNQGEVLHLFRWYTHTPTHKHAHTHRQTETDRDRQRRQTDRRNHLLSPNTSRRQSLSMMVCAGTFGHTAADATHLMPLALCQCLATQRTQRTQRIHCLHTYIHT